MRVWLWADGRRFVRAFFPVGPQIDHAPSGHAPSGGPRRQSAWELSPRDLEKEKRRPSSCTPPKECARLPLDRRVLPEQLEDDGEHMNPGIALAFRVVNLHFADEENTILSASRVCCVLSRVGLSSSLSSSLHSACVEWERGERADRKRSRRPSRHAAIEDGVRLATLALQLFLLGIESFRFTLRTGLERRSDAFYEYLKNNMESLVLLLFRSSSAERFHCSTPLEEQLWCREEEEEELLEQLAFLDLLFEAVVEMPCAGESDEPLPLSELAGRHWSRPSGGRLRVRVRDVVRHCQRGVVVDPYQLDDLPLADCAEPVGKRTTLASGPRRKTMICGWNRIEVLRKRTYRDCHVRISRSQPQPALLFLPWKSRSLVISSVHDCPSLIVGPVAGTLLIHGVTNTTISASAHRIVLWRCRGVRLFCLSPNPLLAHACHNVHIAPLNCHYDGLLDELESAGVEWEHNSRVCEVVDLDGAAGCSELPPQHFYQQPVPVQCEDPDEKEAWLLSLPTAYRRAWQQNEAEGVLHSLAHSESLLPHRDTMYLDSKIDVML